MNTIQGAHLSHKMAQALGTIILASVFGVWGLKQRSLKFEKRSVKLIVKVELKK